MDTIQRIREMRDQRGWSTNRLAKMSNLSQSTVSNLFNRSYEPSISTLESLCKGFGISLAEFFNVESPIEVISDEQRRLWAEWSKLSYGQRQAIFSIMKNMQ